jgi:hypothetical protein
LKPEGFNFFASGRGFGSEAREPRKFMRLRLSLKPEGFNFFASGA